MMESKPLFGARRSARAHRTVSWGVADAWRIRPRISSVGGRLASKVMPQHSSGHRDYSADQHLSRSCNDRADDTLPIRTDRRIACRAPKLCFATVFPIVVGRPPPASAVDWIERPSRHGFQWERSPAAVQTAPSGEEVGAYLVSQVQPRGKAPTRIARATASNISTRRPRAGCFPARPAAGLPSRRGGTGWPQRNTERISQPSQRSQTTGG
jgi:hypothetical protein